MEDTSEVGQTVSREEAAAILRDAADGVEGGELQIGGDEPMSVPVPEELEVEVEFEREDGEIEVELELEWPDTEPSGQASGDERTDSEADEQIGAPDATLVAGDSEHGGDGAEDIESGGESLIEPDSSPIGPAGFPKRLAHFELFPDRADEWRWRLVHRNGNVIATSGEGYTRKHNALNGLQSVMANAPEAEVHEHPDR